MAIWFTVRLEDRPGSLARVASALGDRRINITGIVGVAEDTNGTLMMTTSDAEGTRSVLEGLGIACTEHDTASEDASPLSLAGAIEELSSRGPDPQ